MVRDVGRLAKELEEVSVQRLKAQHPMTEDEIRKLVVESMLRTVNDENFVKTFSHQFYQAWKAYVEKAYGMTTEEYARKGANTRKS